MPAAEAVDPYLQLREVALGATSSLPPPPWEHPDVAGLVVDVPMDAGTATVVALADGTVSLYLSGGGASLGLGAFPAVAAAASALLVATQQHVESTADPGAPLPPWGEHDDGALPPPGRIRYHLLAPGRPVTCRDVPGEVFWSGSAHELAAVVDRTHGLVGAVAAVQT